MLSSVIHGRYFLLLALFPALLLVPLVAAHDADSLALRDGLSDLFPGLSSTDPASAATSASAKSTEQPANTATSTSNPTSTASDTPAQQTDKSTASQTTSSSSNDNNNSPPTSTSSSPSTGSQTSTSSNSSPATSTSSNNQPNSTPTQTATNGAAAPPRSSVLTSLSTNSEGQTQTVVVTVAVSASSTSASSSTTAGSGGGGSSSGISTGGIVGLSVAGGVALLSVVAFAIFKFSRKRYLDEYDDGEAIKWPELNTHGDASLALPTHRTGGAGFETSSEVNLTRPDSRAGSIAPSAAASAVDLYPAQHDPYAVPPLPHLNPNVGGAGAAGAQPYHDDPTTAYYDPYNGPIPHTLEGEAIPMTQIGGRARSPMPGAMGMPMGGRMSPAPSISRAPPTTGVRAPSPGPGAAYGGGYAA